VRKPHLWTAALSGALALVTLTADAQAAGLFLPGHGVRPNGRAGAFVASGGGDLNSLWHNPANLAGLGDELELTVDLSLINLDFAFERAPRTLENGDTVTFDRVEDFAPPKPNPQILIGGPLPVDGLKWAFGFYAPYLSGQTFPEDGPQRYALIDNDASILAYLHAAIAWQPNANFRVGFGIQNLVADFVLVNAVSAYPGVFGDPEDEDLDLLARITLNSLFNPSANFGVWTRLHENVEAGLSVQLPTLIRDPAAQMEVRLPSNPAFDDAYLDGDTVQAGMNLPLVARLGLRYVNATFDYELAFVYEGWSIFDEISAVPNDVVVRDVRGLGDIRVAPLTIPLNWQDVISVRNGGEYRLSESIQLRAGYTFETNAIPDEYYSVFLADGIKHIVSLGGTYDFDGWSVDGAFSYYLIPDRNITNSQYRQINPTDTNGESTTIVGNGLYQQSYWIGGLAFNKTF
jgi:long-chain fatty acid transport protein